jgi:hypothetical protein
MSAGRRIPSPLLEKRVPVALADRLRRPRRRARASPRHWRLHSSAAHRRSRRECRDKSENRRSRHPAPPARASCRVSPHRRVSAYPRPLRPVRNPSPTGGSQRPDAAVAHQQVRADPDNRDRHVIGQSLEECARSSSSAGWKSTSAGPPVRNQVIWSIGASASCGRECRQRSGQPFEQRLAVDNRHAAASPPSSSGSA